MMVCVLLSPSPDGWKERAADGKQKNEQRQLQLQAVAYYTAKSWPVIDIAQQINPLKPNSSNCYTLPYMPNLPF